MIANETDFWLHGEAIAPDSLTLAPAASERARQLAAPLTHPGRQWSVYRQALVDAAFQDWLADWAPDCQLGELSGPATELTAAALGNASYQRVGDFRLSLLCLESNEARVRLPRAAIALPDYCAHFYVAIEVWEELQQARVCGFARHDQLRDRLQSAALTPDSDWCYTLPPTWFNPDSSELALQLRCLEPTAIALPSAAPAPASVQRRDFATAKAELHRQERELWESLHWEQMATLLSDPASLSWFLTPPTAAEQVLNAATWLNDRLDAVASELNWVLLPACQRGDRSLEPAAGLRSPAEELDNLLVQLERQGTDIAPEARGGYQDFQLGEAWLRLYAVIWAQRSPEVAEWKLLIVLGTPDSSSLPDGMTLRVSDDRAMLVERTMQQDTDAPYLYARVAGLWEETFTVEVTHPDGFLHAFPVFAFQPRR